MKCPKCLKGVMEYDRPSNGILVWCRECGNKLVNFNKEVRDDLEKTCNNSIGNRPVLFNDNKDS